MQLKNRILLELCCLADVLKPPRGTRPLQPVTTKEWLYKYDGDDDARGRCWQVLRTGEAWDTRTCCSLCGKLHAAAPRYYHHRKDVCSSRAAVRRTYISKETLQWTLARANAGRLKVSDGQDGQKAASSARAGAA